MIILIRIITCSQNGQKVKPTLYINEEVIKKGKDLGLNLSKVTENALIDLTDLNPQKQKISPKVRTLRMEKWWTGGELNP